MYAVIELTAAERDTHAPLLLDNITDYPSMGICPLLACDGSSVSKAGSSARPGFVEPLHRTCLLSFT